MARAVVVLVLGRCKLASEVVDGGASCKGDDVRRKLGDSDKAIGTFRNGKKVQEIGGRKRDD